MEHVSAGIVSIEWFHSEHALKLQEPKKIIKMYTLYDLNTFF